MRAVVSGDFRVTPGHGIVDGNHVLSHRTVFLRSDIRVVGAIGSGRRGGGTEEDRCPPLFRQECFRASKIE